MTLDWASAMPKMWVIQLQVWMIVSMLRCHGNVNLYSSQSRKNSLTPLVCGCFHTIPWAHLFSLRLQCVPHPYLPLPPIHRHSLLGGCPGPEYILPPSLLCKCSQHPFMPLMPHLKFQWPNYEVGEAESSIFSWGEAVWYNQQWALKLDSFGSSSLSVTYELCNLEKIFFFLVSVFIGKLG